MMKIILATLLLFAGSAAAGVDIDTCNVGADPWWPNQKVSPRAVNTEIEIEITLSKATIIDSLSGTKGKSSGLCVLLPEVSTVVVPLCWVYPDIPCLKGPLGRPWVKGCGNPIISELTLTEKTILIIRKFLKSPEPVVLAPQKQIPNAFVKESSTPNAVVREDTPSTPKESDFNSVTFPKRVAEPEEEFIPRRTVKRGRRVHSVQWVAPVTYGSNVTYGPASVFTPASQSIVEAPGRVTPAPSSVVQASSPPSTGGIPVGNTTGHSPIGETGNLM